MVWVEIHFTEKPQIYMRIQTVSIEDHHCTLGRQQLNLIITLGGMYDLEVYPGKVKKANSNRRCFHPHYVVKFEIECFVFIEI